jgi:hypothetical protein
VRRAQARGRPTRQGGFGDIDERAGRLVEAKRPAGRAVRCDGSRPAGRLSSRSWRRLCGSEIGGGLSAWPSGRAIRRRRTSPRHCDAGSSPVRWARTTRPAARSGLSAQGRVIGARSGYTWLAREVLGNSRDTHSKNGRCEPVSAGPGDYLVRYIRSALLTSLPLGHLRRDLGPRSEAELGKNVRPIAVDLAKPSSSLSCVPLPNTVLGDRFGIGWRLSSRFERHETEALRRR